ncbi:MAG: 2-oxoacid:acceptor oxidoreductase subunit alpha [Thermoplasmata archaeon]
MITNDLAVMIGGRAGDGSLVTGEILAKVFRNMGLEVFTIRDFPSNIRGLPTNYTIRTKDRPIMARKDHPDILLAIDEEAVRLHGDELPPDGVLIYDNSSGEGPPDFEREDVHLYQVPLKSIAVDNLGGARAEIFKNVVSLGVLAHLLSVDVAIIKEAIEKEFSRKGEEIVQRNFQALDLGAQYANEHFEKTDPYVLERREKQDSLLILGGHAIAYGALAAGLRFYAGYPITPATEILEWLAVHMPEYNGVVVQAEDEISAVTMCLGASYAGLRSMTGTSGPGADLMAEAISMSGMAELPLVVIHGQRGGPGTGLPTKVEQADLKHVLFASHGDFPRIVLAPGTIEDGFYLTAKALNLAERFQLPVIVLTDLALCQNKQTIPPFDLSQIEVDRGKLLNKSIEAMQSANGGIFQRYALVEDGVSPRSIPSIPGGLYEASSNEHDEMGYTTEDPELRKAMMAKRMRKLETARPELPGPVLHGDPSADLVFLSYGYPTGAIWEAMERLKEDGIATKYVQLRTLWPFPAEEVGDLLADAREILVVEHNYSGQLAALLPALLGKVLPTTSVTRYDGLLMTPGEIVAAAKEVA